MSIEIITNNVSRELIYYSELTDDEKAEKDYCTEDDSFVRYKGQVYALIDFIRVPDDTEFPGWDGYASDSYFSGVLLKLDEDDGVIMGTYFS